MRWYAMAVAVVLAVSWRHGDADTIEARPSGGAGRAGSRHTVGIRYATKEGDQEALILERRRRSFVAHLSRQGSCERMVACSFERSRDEGYEDAQDEDGTGFQVHNYYGDCDGCSIRIRLSAEGPPRMIVGEDEACRSACRFGSSIMRPISRAKKPRSKGPDPE